RKQNEDFDGKLNCFSFRLPSGQGQAEREPLFLPESGFLGFRDFQDFISDDDVVGRASRKLYKNQHHSLLTTYRSLLTTTNFTACT
ncbi:MAG TPA: hypothetical protein PLQ17_05605, partial [Saprospiraceae bacterium]|nr:hypothetical protein [Saprospiraceae bacterium]